MSVSLLAGRRHSRGVNMSGWKVLRLYMYYVTLSALAALLAAAAATLPYWI
jgi:hypothetical protein